MTKGTPASSQIITLERLLEQCQEKLDHVTDERDDLNRRATEYAAMNDQQAKRIHELLAALNEIHLLRPIGNDACDYSLTVEHICRTAITKVKGKT